MTPHTPLGHAAVPTSIIWDDALTEYNFGPEHPMSPIRLDLTARLAREAGLFEPAHVSVVRPGVATEAQLARVHEAEYIEAVRAASSDPESADASRGLGTADNPAFEKMHEASARIAGGSLLAAERIVSGEAVHAVNFSGGLHHAMPGAANGFCVYNDAALGIARLLDSGVSRVLYIDTDAHHGDGVQTIFWDDPRVLTVSIHESGRTLFPGTGYPTELGGPGALGSAVNVALPAKTSDADWLRAFHAVVPQLAGAFDPEVIVSQHGCDAHKHDPLTNLRLSLAAGRQAAVSIDSLARKFSEGRWLATGGGGYNAVEVVPRAWTHLLGVASSNAVKLDEPTPQAWRDYVVQKYGVDAPRVMGDGDAPWWQPWERGFDPEAEIDRAILATRREAFPLHGLDPWQD